MKSTIQAIGTALWCVIVFPYALIVIIAIHAFNAFAGDPPDPDEHD